MPPVLVLVLILAAGPAAGQARVTPDAFETLAEGRTLHFSLDGRSFGAEQFFPGRRSLWRFGDGACAEGRWFAKGEAICFVYEDAPDPVCWHFERRGAGYAARALENGAPTDLALALDRIDAAPLVCPGPRVGS